MSAMGSRSEDGDRGSQQSSEEFRTIAVMALNAVDN